LQWADILWKKRLIFIRHEIAKETRARDRKRYIPLEEKAAEILGPLAGSGAVMPCSPSHFNRSRRKLAAAMRLKFPENCLRNSYATYALTFRSLGDVAKAMGDAEATVKRYYIETLELGIGREWFAPKL
jgi:integrase